MRRLIYNVCYHSLQGTYQDYIGADEEVKQLLSDIIRLVNENSEECKVCEPTFNGLSDSNKFLGRDCSVDLSVL